MAIYPVLTDFEVNNVLITLSIRLILNALPTVTCTGRGKGFTLGTRRNGHTTSARDSAMKPSWLQRAAKTSKTISKPNGTWIVYTLKDEAS